MGTHPARDEVTRKAREFAMGFWRKNPDASISTVAKRLNNDRLTTHYELIRSWHNEFVSERVAKMGGFSPGKKEPHEHVPPQLKVVPTPSKILGTHVHSPPIVGPVVEVRTPLLPPPTVTERPTLPEVPRTKQSKKAPSHGKSGLKLVPFTGKSFIVGDDHNGERGITVACLLECGHVTIRGMSNTTNGNSQSPNYGAPLASMGCALCTKQDAEASKDREAEERAKREAEKAAAEAKKKAEQQAKAETKFKKLMQELGDLSPAEMFAAFDKARGVKP